MNQIEELSEIIEKLRLRLHETSHGKCFTDPEVIRVSQELNKLLNEYQNLIRQKCK
ncbi:MAG: Sporulation stage 0, Spo0E-like regulatory phosphatase [Sporomusa sp.]|nr:Sporulation stage 0, Spo0E-like regulatory phosphatase [Sporomusa sp.]